MGGAGVLWGGVGGYGEVAGEPRCAKITGGGRQSCALSHLRPPLTSCAALSHLARPSHILPTSLDFITVLVLKILFGTTWELSRPWALLSKTIADRCTPPDTIGPSRTKRLRMPDPCRFGWIYPQLLLVIAICVTYQVVTPLVGGDWCPLPRLPSLPPPPLTPLSLTSTAASARYRQSSSLHAWCVADS